ncbi:hypothetical protein [Aeromicrobium sp. Sec7.5]|uniref:hypothetical protein n=1 Tax=Aeromicrobium sp. Sec7.5 TaxID=3121276 RepID=UPI002FE45867
MKAARALLVVAGVGFGLWGVWLMRDFTSERLVSAGIWLGGGIVVHDAVLAPLTIAIVVVVARLLPRYARAPMAIAFLVWSTLTVVFIPVLSGQGGKPDNDTILNRPYLASWLVLTAVLFAVALVVALQRRSRTATPAATAED